MRTEITSNAGPFTFTVDTVLSPGETHTIDLRSMSGGPRGEIGYFKKYFGRRQGFDTVLINNGSDLVVHWRPNGEGSSAVPPATSQTVSGQSPEGHDAERSTGYWQVTVENPQFNASDISEGDVSVTFKNGPRQEERDTGFRLSITDLIPGVVTNG